MSKPTRRDRFWTYAEASRTVPYVRRLLATLRHTYIHAWHLYGKSHRAADPDSVLAEWVKSRDEGVAVLEELDRLGIIPYQSPLRGIALFRFSVEVEVDDVATDDLIAFFVYKDNRDQIETFAFAPDIYDHDGLFGAERPIPDALKAGATFLKREEVMPVVTPEPENCP
jgi:hypothetical protein